MNDAWGAFERRLFQQNQFAIKLGLEAMREALVDARSHFGLEGNSGRVVLVAGTNGKGTTCAFLDNLLGAHDLRVGLYTSPHLIGLEERFRLDGRPMARAPILEVGHEVLSRYGSEHAPLSRPLTFFELTTLMAFVLFARAQVEVALYEVGLGGRLDATNAIEPDLSVITTLGYDHQRYLGDTLAEIAREKLAISRPGVPLVIGAQEHEEADEAIAAQRGGHEPLWRLDETDTAELSQLAPARRRHAATALCAARALAGPLSSERRASALSSMRWPGRLQRQGAMILDGAHNADGVAWMMAHLERAPGAVVFGAMADKDLAALSAPLRERGWPVYAAEIDNARAASAAQLREALTGCDLRGVGAAAEVLARAHAEAAGTVLVYGSLYLVGEALAWSGLGPGDMWTRAS